MESEPEEKPPEQPVNRWRKFRERLHRIAQSLRDQKGPSTKTTLIGVVIVGVVALGVLAWLNRGPEEKPPVTNTTVVNPVPNTVPLRHKMFHWDVPLDSADKRLLSIDRTGSDTIPAFDGADIVWSVPNKSFIYDVTTPSGTYACTGEVCQAIPGQPLWVTFSSSTPGSVWFWYERQPSKREQP